jgi:hypothetical protein
MRATPGDNSGLRGWDCCVQLGEIALYDREGAYLAGAEVCHTLGRIVVSETEAPNSIALC